MKTRDDLDPQFDDLGRRLQAWMTSTAQRRDAVALAGGAVRRTEAVRQRPRLLVRTGLGRSQRPWIVLGLAAALALPAGWLAAGAPLPTPSVPSIALQTPGPTSPTAPTPAPTRLADARPRTLATDFINRPFEYVIPAGSAIRRLDGGGVRELVKWVDGPDVAPVPSPDNVNPGMQPQPGHVRGVILGSAEEAWSHGNNGRFMLRTAPAELLTDLRDTANVNMGPIHGTTLDGRPALTAMLSGVGGFDIHVTGRMMGLSGNYVLLNIPSRLTVADVDGTTVFILTWARTAADLDAWLPTADELIASIHFLPADQP
jgi:hypothetical protein